MEKKESCFEGLDGPVDWLTVFRYHEFEDETPIY